MKDTKSLEIFEFIQKFQSKNGFAPSVREICRGLSITSTATVAYNIDKLVRLGKLSKSAFKNRTLNIVSDKQPLCKIPLVGNVAAGTPILALENIEETYSIPKNLFGNDNLFALRVHGDSMINAGIFDGDTIVVKKQDSADNGQIVVAMIEDSATVKRFFKEKNRVRLQPENDMLKPIFAKNVKIEGVVVGLLRKF